MGHLPPLRLHFLWYKSLQKVEFFDHLPPSSCKRSFWTAPYQNYVVNLELDFVIWRKITRILDVEFPKLVSPQIWKWYFVPKLFWPFIDQINCSCDLKKLPSALNIKSFSQSLEQFFLTEGEKKFETKYQCSAKFCTCDTMHMLLTTQWIAEALSNHSQKE